MTAEERGRLKLAVSDAVREREIKAKPRRGCNGCGCDYDNYTTSCRTCMSRRFNRTRQRYGSRACKGSTYLGGACMNRAVGGDYCYAHREEAA